MREEALSKWIDKRIGETFVRVDDPYRDCAMDMPWLTESINASGTLHGRRTKHDGWNGPPSQRVRSSGLGMTERTGWLSSGNNLEAPEPWRISQTTNPLDALAPARSPAAGERSSWAKNTSSAK